MKIPKTTEKKPYIKFRFDRNGKITKLFATSDWWGGINSGFHDSNGGEGNTCKPKDLNRYIKFYKLKRIKEIKIEIKRLKNELDNLSN